MTTQEVAAPPRIALPRYRSPSIYEATRGPRVAQFAADNLTVGKGPRVGQPLNLLLWQRWLINEVLEERDNGRLRYRRGLVGVGRQNGKSVLGSVLALDHIISPTPGLEAYSAAGDRMQARIVFGEARRQVINSPTLSAITKVYRDAIEVPETGNVYRVLSADSKLAQGLSPSLVVFDEVHVQKNDDLWDAMTLGTGARVEPLVLGITTAGDDPESLCGRLYEYGKAVASGEEDDPTFGFWWWEPKGGEDADMFDRQVWEQANPSLVEGVTFKEDLVTAARQQHPISFRRYRLNQWYRHGGKGWMDMAAWDTQARPDRSIKKGASVFLTFDGSVDEDSTVLGVMDISDIDDPHFDVLGVWERGDNDDRWSVPRDEVHAEVDAAFKKYRVVKMMADPAWWRSELQQWSDMYGKRKVLEWPVTNARMMPAVAETYKRVKEGGVTHSGNVVLRRHIQNAVVKDMANGQTIRKEKADSPKKIDAAVTLCIAVDGLERYAKPVSKLVTF